MKGGAGDDTFIVSAAGDIVTGEVAGLAGGTDEVKSSAAFRWAPTSRT